MLDEPEAERLGIDAFERTLEAFLELGTEEGGARLELLAAYTPQKLEEMVRTVHSRLRSRGERDPALPPLPAAAGMGRQRGGRAGGGRCGRPWLSWAPRGRAA